LCSLTFVCLQSKLVSHQNQQAFKVEFRSKDMDLHLQGKNVLISGASKGIGLACAKEFAAEGCNLHLVSRTEEDLINARNKIKTGTDVDITIHSLDLKVLGYINMTRRYYPLIKENGGGVIMNVIGLAGVRVDRNYIAGSAGNASIIGFTNAMGAHALDEGMRVLGVCPGAVQTERITTMLKTRAKDEKGDENRWQDYFSGMPLNRPALVEEVADVVVFLCSDRASWLTGTTINLDGGVANRGGY
jgi:NAD(P)-dependent dehydrogenase (short-subunit alcohol dehydrogenase family)